MNKENYSSYINYLLIVYAFCLPLSKAGTNIIELFLLIIWILEGKWKEKLNSIKNNLLVISVLLLILVSIFSIIWSSDVGYAIDYVLKYHHLLILVIIYTSFNIKFTKYILSSFILSMFISELFSYGIFFDLIEYNDVLSSDPTPFMNHTDYSTYLAFTSIILLIRIFQDKELISKLIYMVFYITITANLFINGGRTGQIIFIVITFITIFSFVRSKIKALLLTVSLLTIIFTLAYNFSPNFYDRANQLKKDIDNMFIENNYKGSFSTRVSLWIIGVDKFADNIFIGAGIGDEMNDIKEYAIDRGYDYEHLKNFADHHNGIITLSIQLGLFGLLIHLLIFYSIFKLKFYSIEYKILKNSFLITFLLLSMIGLSLHLMNPMVLFALFGGLLSKISKTEMEKTKLI